MQPRLPPTTTGNTTTSRSNSSPTQPEQLRWCLPPTLGPHRSGRWKEPQHPQEASRPCTWTIAQPERGMESRHRLQHRDLEVFKSQTLRTNPVPSNSHKVPRGVTGTGRRRLLQGVGVWGAGANEGGISVPADEKDVGAGADGYLSRELCP